MCTGKPADTGQESSRLVAIDLPHEDTATSPPQSRAPLSALCSFLQLESMGRDTLHGTAFQPADLLGLLPREKIRTLPKDLALGNF